MPDANPPARIVLTTAATIEEARSLGHTLIEERLVACATLIPAVEAIFQWQGKLESTIESGLRLKTGPDQLPALEDRLHELHTYQTPEFLVLNVEAGSHPYLEWLQSALRRV